MANYGELIETGEPTMEKFNSLLTKFYNDPVMIKLKTTGTHSMYVAKVQCMLSTQKRYIILYVDEDGYHPGSSRYLRDLDWVNFQTRTLDELPLPANTPYVQYAPIRLPGLDAVINKTNGTETDTTYNAVGEFPLVVTMLHPKKMSYNYQDKGSIVSALETYQTILTWKHD